MSKVSLLLLSPSSILLFFILFFYFLWKGIFLIARGGRVRKKRFRRQKWKKKIKMSSIELYGKTVWIKKKTLTEIKQSKTFS